MKLPKNVQAIIDTLEQAGFEGYGRNGSTIIMRKRFCMRNRYDNSNPQITLCRTVYYPRKDYIAAILPAYCRPIKHILFYP